MADQGPDWTIDDIMGDHARVYSACFGNAVGIEFDVDEEYGGPFMHYDLPRLDALIAELTRRRALIAGEPTRTPEGVA